MTLITHVIMQSKSKVGTRNVRVKIERQVGVVLTVEFNGTPLIDDLPSLAIQRFEPVRKPVVIFDEVDKYCQFYEVKRSDDTGFFLSVGLKAVRNLLNKPVTNLTGNKEGK